MTNNQISALVVADSVNPWGDRITSIELVMPRMILAEFNTHRMFSRNSASSRAIPFFRMVDMVVNNTFIPIAWQTHHSGMQGAKYISVDEVLSPGEFFDDFMEIVRAQAKEDKVVLSDDFINIMKSLEAQFYDLFAFTKELTVVKMWLIMRDLCIFCSTMMYSLAKVSKQICNRLLEPFMYHKVLMTATEFSNFFDLRSPTYEHRDRVYQSRRQLIVCEALREDYPYKTDLDWLAINKGQAEIHMMDLAEKMWDAMTESKPLNLVPGEWHIPYRYSIDPDKLEAATGLVTEEILKVVTGMAARVSYTTVGDEKEVKYETLINIHDRMEVQVPFHASPFEHPAQCPTEEEYFTNVKGKVPYIVELSNSSKELKNGTNHNSFGWFRNYRGWKSYRQIIEESK